MRQPVLPLVVHPISVWDFSGNDWSNGHGGPVSLLQEPGRDRQFLQTPAGRTVGFELEPSRRRSG
jgi:hypothetical protein